MENYQAQLEVALSTTRVYIRELLDLWEQTPVSYRITASFGVAGLLWILRRYYFAAYRHYYNYPPIVAGAPYFGSALTLASNLDYFDTVKLPNGGPITLHYIGPTQGFVTLNNLSLIQALYKDINCINRPQFVKAIAHASGFPTNLMTSTDDELYHKRRQFVARSIAKMANGTYFNEILNDTLNKHLFASMNDLINKNNGIWMNLNLELKQTSFNLVFGSLFGIENILAKDSDDYKKVFKLGKQITDNWGQKIAALTFPILRLFHGNVDGRLSQAARAQNELFRKYTQKCRDSYETRANKGEILFDAMFEEIEKDRKESNNNNGSVTETMLEVDTSALLSASLDTISHNCEAILLYLAKFPGLQREIYNEISEFAIKNKLIRKINDGNVYAAFDISKAKEQCNVFAAFVSESMRLAVLIPRAFPRALSTDCTLKFNMSQTGDCTDIVLAPIATPRNDKKYDYEYNLSKDFVIEGNFGYTNLSDKSVWSVGSDPSEFDINRWLRYENSERKYISDLESNSLPFSSGIRDCVGKLLGYKAIFAIVGNLILNYQFRSIDGKERNEFPITYKNGHIREISPRLPLRVYARDTSQLA